MGGKNFLIMAFVVISMVIMALISIANYDECKNNGFTTMYCMTGK